MNIIKTIAIVFGLCIISMQVFSQKSNGIYFSLSDFNQMKPDTSSSIIIERRTQGQIYMVGGNDYKIYSLDKALRKSLKKECWGIYSNDSIFLNCCPLKLGLWYAYAERINDKLLFSAAITMDREERQKIAMIGTMAGPIGGALAGGQLALKRFYYIMDLKTGETEYLTKDKMIEVISSQSDLVEKYKKESEPDRIETIKYYLSELKKRI